MLEETFLSASATLIATSELMNYWFAFNVLQETVGEWKKSYRCNCYVVLEVIRMKEMFQIASAGIFLARLLYFVITEFIVLFLYM